MPGLPQPLQLQLHGEQDRVISHRIRQEGIWEPYETELVMALLGPGDIFVDVGANIGYFSVIAAALVGGQGAVHAFEPHPENYRLLCENLAANGLAGRAQTYCAGLSDSAGQARLFLSGDNSGDHQIYASSEKRDSQAITLLRGTEVEALAGSGIDLLKVDTQGSETRVLRGLLPLLLEQQRPCRVLVELTPHSLREAGSSGRELIELLAQLGQPMWMIEHLEHRLIAATAEELARWSDNWDEVPESRGFVNVLVGEAPPER